VESKGCSLDGWEKRSGSHLMAGLAAAGQGVCATTWQTCCPRYVRWPRIVWLRTGLGMWQEPSPAVGDNTVPSISVLQFPPLVHWATLSLPCP